MPRTSNKAEKIVEFVNAFIAENGYSPSVREIGEAVGLRSTASVSYHLQALQEKGVFQAPEAKGRKRALVTGARPGQIPVIGVVTAGLPILAVENVESYFPVPMEFMPNEQSFMLKVKGESMINAGIFDGDQVLVKQQSTAEDGDIVVALIDDGATVKTFHKEKNIRSVNDIFISVIRLDVFCLSIIFTYLLFLLCFFPCFQIKMLPDQLHNYTGKQEYCDQVWDYHKSVECLCDVPHQSEVHGRTNDRHQRI